MRLDKFVCHTAGYSRLEARRLVKARRVSVNGSICRDFGYSLVEGDAVCLDGEPLQLAGPRYFLLNKPVGYVCATQDGEHPTVLDLLHEPRKQELHIAGRLDIDTTGLVLITDDGQWSHRVMSPKHESKKTYLVETADPIDERVISLFYEGVMLNGEDKPTLPAELIILAPHKAELSLCEGRYHQVKRMFAAVGNRVTQLHRQSIGEIQLDASLAVGSYRILSKQEISFF